MNATIKDIGREANVSYATVSRAFNNKYGVKPETRARILEVAKRLNYSPNGIARGLVNKRTKSIGLIIPDITNPYFPEVARGIEEGAKEQGYSVFLCNTNWEQDRQAQYIELLAEKRVDGLIIAPVSNAVDPAQERLFNSIPVVYVDRPPQNTQRSYVVIDNIRGGFIATRHLIEAGYRKIGFIGAVEQSMPVDERLEGFKMAMERYGLPIEERDIKLGHFTQEAGTKLIREMIGGGDYPRAIFAENDLLALGVIEGVRSLGLAVPADVAVVGFDDIHFASFENVQLTTICQPKYEMGKAAVRILLEEISWKEHAARGGARNGQQADKKVMTACAEETENAAVSAETSGGRQVVVLEPELIVRKTSLIT
ncbi:MAG: LacI family DNA-binding transcriptional regulator [Spirochaetia bacterium]|jgi:LacI family transcriptional regulator